MDCPVARHSYRGGVWDYLDCPIALHSHRGGVWDCSWTVPSHVTRIVVVCGTIHGLSHRTSRVSWWCVGLFMDCPISRHAYRGGVWDYSWTVPSHVTRIVVVCGTIHGLSHSHRGGVWDCSWTVPSHVTRIVVVCGTIHGLSRRPSLQSWWCVGLQADCPIAHRSNRGGVWDCSWTVPSHVTRIVVVCGTIHGLSHIARYSHCRATDRIKPIHASWKNVALQIT